MSEVLIKARELGEEIARCPELTAMRDAELAMLNDADARLILQEFETKRQKYAQMAAAGLELTPEQMQDVSNLEERMLNHPLIYAYLKAQQDFERILAQVNHIIAQAITGAASPCSAGDCGSGCSCGC